MSQEEQFLRDVMQHTGEMAQSSVRRKRAIIYCRVSSDKQEQDGESLEYQEEKCRRYAELQGLDVLMVLKEAKSGFIHYSLREQLTLARQFIRDHMADVIIVWDLRRFSRNFVHSAMIFEEIEGAGAEIVSVSENIDNGLTGKLIRSILAWSAESEREKILEYANRHWQTRLEHNLPVGTGRAPYGWEWGDKEKTFYVINQEEAAVRFSIFHMFVELDMSLRGIAHKLTEDFLLKGHIICRTCNYRMAGRYQTSREVHTYTYYACVNHRNKYDACPDLTIIRTDKVDQMVWDDCCRVFERLDLIRPTIEHSIEESLQDMLEDTKGKLLVLQLTEGIAYAQRERAKHPEGSYYHELISQDIREKEERLAKYEEEYRKSQYIVRLSHLYQKSVLGFLNFLNVMKGKYHEATVQERRNALDVLGVKVYVHPDTQEAPLRPLIETDQEWLSISEASEIIGINKNTLHYHIGAGELTAQRRNVPLMVIHRDELTKFLKAMQRDVSLEQYPDEWFTVNKLVTLKIANYSTIHRAIRLGEVQTETMDVTRPFIHRDELNRFLQESPVRPKSARENVQPRIEITYTPIFTGVQSSLR